MFELFIKEQLRSFLYLHEQAEAHFEKISNSLENKIDNFVNEYEDEPKTEYEQIEFDREIGNYIDELTPYTNEYPEIMRKSLLVSIWSFYEHQLINLCKKKDPDKQFRTDILENAKKYIKNEMKLAFPDQGSDWIFIRHVRRIRNCIVHNGSYVQKNSALENAINHSLSNIKISTDSSLIIKKQFIPEFLEIIGRHLQSLLVEETYKEIKQ